MLNEKYIHIDNHFINTYAAYNPGPIIPLCDYPVF